MRSLLALMALLARGCQVACDLTPRHNGGVARASLGVTPLRLRNTSGRHEPGVAPPRHKRLASLHTADLLPSGEGAPAGTEQRGSPLKLLRTVPLPRHDSSTISDDGEKGPAPRRAQSDEANQGIAAPEAASVERGRLCRQNEELRCTIQDMEEALQRQSADMSKLSLQDAAAQEQAASDGLAADLKMCKDEAEQLRVQLQRQLQALGSAGMQLRKLTLDRDKYKHRSQSAARLAIGGWLACDIAIRRAENAHAAWVGLQGQFERALMTAMHVSLAVYASVAVLQELGGTAPAQRGWVDTRLMQEIDQLKAEAQARAQLADELRASNARLFAERASLISEVQIERGGGAG